MQTYISKYYKVLQSITKYYKVLQSITKYYKVLQCITKYYKVYYLLMTHLLTINHCLAQTIKMQTQGGNNHYLRMACCADSASSARRVRAHQLQSSQVIFANLIFSLSFSFWYK